MRNNCHDDGDSWGKLKARALPQINWELKNAQAQWLLWQ